MKKWGLFLLVVAMMAAPMLACGFPLPAGTEMMRVSKAICAEGEAPDSCQARQDAFQLMGKLQSAVIPDLEMVMTINTDAEPMEMTIKGSFEYVLAESNEGLGANVYAKLTDGAIIDETGNTQSLTGTEFIVIGNKGYTSQDGGKSWTFQELDQNTLLGLGLILGLGGPTGTGLDLYAAPGIFTVTAGEDVDYEGQAMQVQTLTMDLQKMLSDPTALTALMEDGFAAGSSLGIDETTLGMPPEQFAAVAPMLLPMLTGTTATTTLNIGKEDGYIHYIDESMVFKMDMTSMDATAGTMEMTYALTGHITQHNEPLTVVEPTGATEGGGGLFGEGGGLFGEVGNSLFGAP